MSSTAVPPTAAPKSPARGDVVSSSAADEKKDQAADDNNNNNNSKLYEINIPMNYDEEGVAEAEKPAVNSTTNNNNGGTDDDEEVLEVFYNEGATDLFLSLENTDWRRALHIIQQKPDQAKVWVISTGTVETTFGWSLWRRLPLHEACRRQGPAWLISALLSVYPTAAEQATQFGELPLHLAVECGAPPEVVNLLVVAHWHGIVAMDQSGRTPLAILHDSEMLAMEDHQVVFESLTRSQETYQTMLEEHQEEVSGIKMRHAAGLVAIRQQHDEDLQQEQEQQEKLLAEVERLTATVDESKVVEKKNAEQLQHLGAMAQSQKTTLHQVQDQLNQETTANSQKAARINLLEQQVAAREAQVQHLQQQVHELQSDLAKLAGWQQDTLSRQINHTEESMQVMVEQFVGLVDLLSGQGQRMTSLLKARHIALPPKSETGGKSSHHSKRKHDKKEEKKTTEETRVLDQDMLNNIAAAASSALQD